MDVDEEPSSYLNYLNDGDTPNTFLLGDNGVMLEPMFMDITDWPSEGFSVLQSNPIIAENEEDATQSTTPKQKEPLIITEENCTLITTTNTEPPPESSLVETCTIIAENGVEQTILVDKNFGVISNQQSLESSSNFVDNCENVEQTTAFDLVTTSDVEQTANQEYSDFDIVSTSQNNFLQEQTGPEQENIQGERGDKQPDYQNVKLGPNFHQPEADYQNFDANSEIQSTTEPQQVQFQISSSDFETGNLEFQKNGLEIHVNEPKLQNNESEFENVESNYEIQPDSTTYINYDPIVKEKENGLREIYLTEKDIFNDAKVIQLLNSDGSVITIDKALLNSIDVYKPHKSVLKPIEILENEIIVPRQPNIKEFFSTVSAKKCKICGFLMEKTDDMIGHILEMHSEKLGMNPFEEKEKLVKTTTNQRRFGAKKSLVNERSLDYLCEICKEVSFSSEQMRNEHYKKVHSEKLNTNQKPKLSLKDMLENLIAQQLRALKKYKCPIKGCLASLPTDELREKHLKLHIGDKKNHYKCSECPEKFYAWRLMKAHMLKRHQQDFGTLICPMCSKFKTYTASTLRSHMNGHKEEDQSFICPTCGEGFPSYNKMKNHQVVHNQAEDPNEVVGWPILQKCNTCGILFNSRKNLKNHIRSVHQNYRPYVCKICGHKTTRKAMLDLHYRQHTGIKPYKCLYCEYRCGDHNCLRKHMMTHVETTKQYTCPYCPYSCIQTNNLKSHIKTKHPNKPGVYRCKHCSYTGINLHAWIVHEKSHEFGRKGRGANQLQVIDVAIRVPDRENKTDTDEDSQNCFYEEQHMEEPIDTGGITIPAGSEVPILTVDEDTCTL